MRFNCIHQHQWLIIHPKPGKPQILNLANIPKILQILGGSRLTMGQKRSKAGEMQLGTPTSDHPHHHHHNLSSKWTELLVRIFVVCSFLFDDHICNHSLLKSSMILIKNGINCLCVLYCLSQLWHQESWFRTRRNHMFPVSFLASINSCIWRSWWNADKWWCGWWLHHRQISLCFVLQIIGRGAWL